MQRRFIPVKIKRLFVKYNRITVLVVATALVFLLGASEALSVVTGQQLWVRRHGGPGQVFDRAKSAAVDSNGNVYITGTTEDIEWSDFATVKYTPGGTKKWVRYYNGQGNQRDEAVAVMVDGNDNVYVTGFSYTGPGSRRDFATIKYDANGAKLWVRRYKGPKPGGNDEATAMAIDVDGNIYIVGKSEGIGTQTDFALIKYDAAGNRKWVRRYNGRSNLADVPAAISIDPLKNILLTGESYSSDFFNDFLTVKYDPVGNRKWVKRYDGPAHGTDAAEGVAADSAGNVYVTGSSFHSKTFIDFATVKYDRTGRLKWVRRFDGPGQDSARAVAVDNGGNIYVAGRGHGSDRFASDYVTIKYSTGGATRWARRYSGPGEQQDFAEDLAIDHDGNVLITGFSPKAGVAAQTIGIGEPQPNYDFATVKYSPTGDRLWARRYDGPEKGHDGGQAVVADRAGNVYVAGFSNADYALIKYAP